MWTTSRSRRYGCPRDVSLSLLRLLTSSSSLPIRRHRVAVSAASVIQQQPILSRFLSTTTTTAGTAAAATVSLMSSKIAAPRSDTMSNETDNDPTIGNRCIPVNNYRSKEETQKLVQRRVLERSMWNIHGVQATQTHPSASERWELIQTIPSMLLRPPSLSRKQLQEQFPVLPMDWNKLTNPPVDQVQVTWMGHSTVLIQMNGCTILTDPIFSSRCSPSQWFGPQRYQPPPCTVQELYEHNVSIDYVVISHNHYDHLDYNSIMGICRLYDSATGSLVEPQFIVPLGLMSWFRDHVSSTLPIYELDWHEYMENIITHTTSLQDDDPTTNPTMGSTITSTATATEKPRVIIRSVPMRHWTMRVQNRDETLWCGYSIETQTTLQKKTKKVLFTGDTAWFDDLEQIGTQYGPYDVAAIPIGAYEPRSFMKYHHINVEEAIRLKDAVQATFAVPIHWGTFPLTTEPILEPRQKLVDLMSLRLDASTFVPWNIGETKQF